MKSIKFAKQVCLVLVLPFIMNFFEVVQLMIKNFIPRSPSEKQWFKCMSKEKHFCPIISLVNNSCYKECNSNNNPQINLLKNISAES